MVPVPDDVRQEPVLNLQCKQKATRQEDECTLSQRFNELVDVRSAARDPVQTLRHDAFLFHILDARPDERRDQSAVGRAVTSQLLQSASTALTARHRQLLTALFHSQRQQSAMSTSCQSNLTKRSHRHRTQTIQSYSLAGGSGISWPICKSAPRPGQIPMPAPHYSTVSRPDDLPSTQSTASKH